MTWKTKAKQNVAAPAVLIQNYTDYMMMMVGLEKQTSAMKLKIHSSQQVYELRFSVIYYGDTKQKMKRIAPYFRKTVWLFSGEQLPREHAKC